MQNSFIPTLLFQNCHNVVKRKSYLYSRWTSELINKWLEESCDESWSEVEVSDNSNSYFSEKIDAETINSVSP